MINFLTKVGAFLPWAFNQLCAFPGKLYRTLCYMFNMSSSLYNPYTLIMLPLTIVLVLGVAGCVIIAIEHVVDLKKSIETIDNSDYKLISTTVVKEGHHSYTQKCWMKIDNK